MSPGANVVPRIEVHRYMRVDPSTGLLDPGLMPRDLVVLVLPDVKVSGVARTLPTHVERGVSPPIIQQGWYPDAYCAGKHRGRPAFVQQGYTAPLYRRHDGSSGNDSRGLNIHDWRGRSDGCITVPHAWIAAALEAFALVGELRKHPDGRPCIGLRVIDYTGGDT